MRSLAHTEKYRGNLQPSYLAVAIALLLPTLSVQAKDYFNPALLEQPGESTAATDLSAFENGGQLPGRYPVEIWLNDERVDSRDVVFFQTESRGLQPCLSMDELRLYGVKWISSPTCKSPVSAVWTLPPLRKRRQNLSSAHTA